jgi:hypothetical protein
VNTLSASRANAAQRISEPPPVMRSTPRLAH